MISLKSLKRQRSNSTSAPSAVGSSSYIVMLIATIVAIGAIYPLRRHVLPGLNNFVFDEYQRLKPRVWNPNMPVRIVDIDDASLSRIGQWPWPRTVIAKIVTRLHRLGAAAVAFDIVFAEPDKSSPERLIATLPDLPGRRLLAQELRGRPSNDAQLAEAMTKVPTVVGAVLTQGGPNTRFPTRFGLAIAGDNPLPFLPHFSNAVIPLPSLIAASAGVGALNWLPDRDQVVRKVPLVDAIGKKIVPSLALESLRVAQHASTIIIRTSNANGATAFGEHTGVNTIKVGDLVIPTDSRGALRVYFSRTEAGRFIPAWKLLAGRVDPSQIKNRIIIIGSSAAGLRDIRATPVNASVAGVEIQAQALEQIISGSWLRRPDWMPGAEFLIAVFLAFAVGMALPRVRALPGALVAVTVIGAVIGTSWHQFSANGVLFDPIFPSFSVAAAYLSCVVWLYRSEQRQRKFVHEAFGRYVSPAVVARLAENPRRFALGGEARVLTVMFCDIRGFTSLSETLDAQELARFMNEYLTAMSDAILATGGTIDKYIGDEVMAFWNAPLDDSNHARNAMRAAIAMTRQLADLNDRRRMQTAAHGAPYQEIEFRIGLATGQCSVGNFGSLHRFDYSALGDNVNLASRLEGANKFYRTRILASETTRSLSPEMGWIEVDHVRVKGKAKSSKIFTLAGPDMDPESSSFARLLEIHDKMLAAYYSKDFASAAVLAKQARSAGGSWVQDLYIFYEQRCFEFARLLPEKWSPITDLEKL